MEVGLPVVGGRDGGGDEASENEGDDVVARNEHVHKDRIEHADDGEAPADAVDCLGRVVKELVDDISEEEDVAVKSGRCQRQHYLPTTTLTRCTHIRVQV